MQKDLERLVWTRAANRCEYCRAAQSWYLTPFQIDHVVSKKHEGKTVESNLALACFHCNLHKGSDIAGIDGRAVVRLFDPRVDDWLAHFELVADGTIVGQTASGRVTVRLLKMNDAETLRVRHVMIELGVLSPIRRE